MGMVQVWNDLTGALGGPDLDEDTLIFERVAADTVDPFPPALTDDEILDIVDEFTELLADW
jgi:hypothetical protein